MKHVLLRFAFWHGSSALIPGMQTPVYEYSIGKAVVEYVVFDEYEARIPLD